MKRRLNGPRCEEQLDVRKIRQSGDVLGIPGIKQKGYEMRAWVYHGNQDLRIEDVPEPIPGPGEVRVRIAYNGICGSDLHEIFNGPMFTPLETAHPTTGHRGPVVLGHEASGIVDAVGSGDIDVEVGQRVAIEPVFRVPGDDANYNLDAAFYGLSLNGFLADFAVAWRAVERADLSVDDSVVVFGGGPIGIAAALSLRAKKINRIVIVEPAHRRRSVVRGMGFDTLDPTSADFRDNLASLAGSGVQACINAAGVAPVMAQAIDILAPGGKLMVVATHLEPVPIDLNQLLMAEKTILTSIGYRDDFPNVIEQQARGAFPTSSWVETVPFDALVETGLSRLRTGEAIKTLIEVNGG
ncbi:(R,R)-butanediol dehydrogenase / meso-butanediol dehydrogenase / diacetyl reductase [Rhodococcus koreensis]|uniref:(R,R)-butanediol dehydrogenase / meso-butanediol dehydrogenase / diacetyl reductase n=2 Tax=Rhodococcus koreensis TaxID=99653 RepID=A0A1H4X121_9NOCA|nr:(R,R)-butanediol dehydrogenase / meso-butanediol dehydrogenase / diacetyl reductase [Rhodococcus koreensis]